MVMEEEDWDLHAVVRGCSTITTTTTTNPVPTTTTTSSVFGFQQPSCLFGGEQKTQPLSLSPHPFEARNSIEELHELCKPFFTRSQPLSLDIPSPLSLPSFSFSSAPLKSVQPQEKQQLPTKRPNQAGSGTTPRSKRRKNQLKKVCQVPVESLSSDIWAWRKYGQKPIKGSPYPRGYYRCSSSKGCLARKQVERNRSDPTMFIVTYTCEHNHPAPTHKNSLAGSTRQKPLTPSQTTTGDKTVTKSPSPGAEEEIQKSESSKEEGEDEFGLSDIELSDDLFEGLDELSQLAEDCFVADPFLDIANSTNWVANNSAASVSAATATTATAAGGSC